MKTILLQLDYVVDCIEWLKKCTEQFNKLSDCNSISNEKA